VVDVARLGAHDLPTLAIIKGITADGDSIPLSDSVRIPAGRQRISFEFAGLSLSIPDRTLFRYTLENFDRGWSAPTATREAAYTNLGPGSYRLHVVAGDLDHVFNSPEATLVFQIEPTYWQTLWFRLAVALSLALVVAAFIRIRMNRLAGQMKLRFEERIAERTRIAQELHDTLLQGFLSASMQLHVAADGVPGNSPMKNKLEGILVLMHRVIDEGRNALRDLRLSHGNLLDLEHAFSHIPAELGAREGIDFRILVEGHERPLHPILRDEVYRIGREALVNAFRHSRATRVQVELGYSANEFRVVVRDNGCGVDPLVLESGREGHWGLSGMRERAERIGARLHLRSRPLSGTEVELSVPGDVAFKIQPRRRFWLLGRGRK
jgi:signal transduction histidine kinase